MCIRFSTLQVNINCLHYLIPFKFKRLVLKTHISVVIYTSPSDTSHSINTISPDTSL